MWRVILLLLLTNFSYGAIQVNWPDNWTEAISHELQNNKEFTLLTRFIDEDDLSEIHCPDYNYADKLEKIDFWIAFIAGLSWAESSFNQKAKSPSMRGHRSYGLLQLAPETAMSACNLIFIEEELLDGVENLRCGIKLLNWQLNGAPDGRGKLKRPDLENQLFGSKILLWGPLRQNDKQGRLRLYNWFNKQLNQLPFCNL